MEFKEPVFVGDTLSCYAKILEVGQTSVKVAVEVTAERTHNGVRRCLHVTSAVITYVAVNEVGRKQKIECSKNQKVVLGIKEKAH
jgi:acyl-CoA thioesterase YciA